MNKPLLVNEKKSIQAYISVIFFVSICYETLAISIDSVFLLIDIFILGIILLSMPKEGLILKKIIKFFKLFKKRIDILNAEAELKFILENQ